MAHFYGKHDYGDYKGFLGHGNYPQIWTSGLSGDRGDLNDKIGSVSVRPGTEVILYENSYYGGASKSLNNINGTTDRRFNLQNYTCTDCGGHDGTWDDVTSSVKVIDEPSRLRDTCANTTGIVTSECRNWCSRPDNKNLCNIAQTEFCTQNPSSITSNTCKTFYNWTKDSGLSTSIYDRAWENYCTSSSANLKSDACKNYIRDNPNTNVRADFDTAWVAYCSTTAGFADTANCGCINSTQECPTITDPACTGSLAYRTQNIDNQQCPNSVNCNQYVANTGSISIDSEISQFCGFNPNADVEGGDLPPVPTPTGRDGSDGSDGSGISLITIIIIALVILALIIAAIIALAVSKKGKGKA